MILKPLPESMPEPMRTCEVCGTQKKSSESINCIIVVGSPGHASLDPFQCGHIEHWSCSIACWKKVAHACIDEHMGELLKQKHEGINS